MENTKINFKKITSLVAAFMLTAAPALATGESDTNSTGFKLVRQEMNIEGNDLDTNKYIKNLEEGFNYLNQFEGPEFEDYDANTKQADLQVLYYMANRTYMSQKTIDELLGAGVVYGEEYIKENFHRAFALIYRINAFNERTIKEDYNNGTMDINHLINPSFLCFDPHDKEIIDSMFNHYFEAYKNGLFESPEYVEVFKEMTTLNAEERKHNAFSSETGAMWLEQVTTGRETVQMLYDYLLRKYTIDELSEYYVREELEKDVPNFVLREDTPSFDFECMNDLENVIFNIGELETFCYDLANNNLYKLFNITENSEDENEIENYSDSEEDTEKPDRDEAKAASEATEEDYTYAECVGKGKEYLSGKIDYEHLETDLNCLVFLTNREYLTEDEQDDLINQGIVFKTKLFAEDGMQNFANAYELINIILDYNQSVIHNDYINGTMDINHLIDPSFLCMNKNDREIVHKLHVTYFEAYKAGRYDNNYFREIYELVGQKILPVGPMWMTNNIVYGDVEQMLRDDMAEDYKPEERDEWFDKQELKAGQWIVRSDVTPKEDSDSELEREAHDFKEIFGVIYTEVNDDIFATFDVNCNIK